MTPQLHPAVFVQEIATRLTPIPGVDTTAAPVRAEAPAPAWSDPPPGDPGIALLDLFASLGDAIAYRIGLLPADTRQAAVLRRPDD